MSVEQSGHFTSQSIFDNLAEMTRDKTVETKPEIRNEIIEKFLHEYAQTGKNQSEVVEKIIEEYPDIDVCEILRPHADLSRE